ncbi:MAG TPA: SH3 domain-containing protein [Anaerolineales bacterium]|nr:SH3 domain-containing protein [Anaerolineales bacterium]
MSDLKRLMPFMVSILVVLACAVPSIPIRNADTMNTNVANTVIAGLTQSVTATFPASSTPSETLAYTSTPTLTYLTARVPSPTLTFTPLPGTDTAIPLLTDTAEPGLVKISVTRPTHCRSGPGKSYEIVGSLLVGMKADVIGRDPTSEYWYIPNPYVFTDYCWVWGEYAEFEGNQLAVPVVMPPPTPTSTATTIPTVDFKLLGSGHHSCDKTHWMNITILNESNFTFSSINIVMQDKVKNISRSVTYNNFPIQTGCEGLTWVETVPADASATVLGPKFDYNIRGNKLHVTVTVCSEKDMKGACSTRETNLVP